MVVLDIASSDRERLRQCKCRLFVVVSCHWLVASSVDVDVVKHRVTFHLVVMVTNDCRRDVLFVSFASHDNHSIAKQRQAASASVFFLLVTSLSTCAALDRRKMDGLLT